MEFVETVRPAIEAADADGRGQVAARAGDPAATRVRGNVAGSGGDAWGMPDDASGAIGCEGAAVETLSQDDEGGVAGPEGGRDHVAGAMLTGPDQGEDATSNTREDDQADPAGADREQAAIDDQPGTDAIDEELSRALAEEIADQQRQDSTQQDARMENLEQLQAAVEAAETEVESEGVVLPDDDPVPDEETAAAAREDGERLAQVLRNRFQKERKRSLLRNQRRGRLDPAAIHRHATGEKRLKHRRETPDETEHHCLFVLDRSGSMRQHIRVAERAMGMLVFALEAVDVDVGVLELLDKEVRLAKAVDREASRATPRLFHGEATGGTPLTDTLHIARERLKQETGNRFLFVVTDGLPSDPERYRDALNRFPVPVVGVNLTTDRAAGESEFHRQVTVPPETGELRRALRQLVQEVLFE
jgi:Mg-chelatase subunit ChlD